MFSRLIFSDCFWLLHWPYVNMNTHSCTIPSGSSCPPNMSSLVYFLYSPIMGLTVSSYTNLPTLDRFFTRILLNVQADVSKVLVWMVSARLPISNSSSAFNKSLGIVPSALTTIGITVTLIFFSFSVFWKSLSTHLSFRLLWYPYCGPPGQQSALFDKFSFCFTFYYLNFFFYYP